MNPTEGLIRRRFGSRVRVGFIFSIGLSVVMFPGQPAEAARPEKQDRKYIPLSFVWMRTPFGPSSLLRIWLRGSVVWTAQRFARKSDRFRLLAASFRHLNSGSLNDDLPTTASCRDDLHTSKRDAGQADGLAYHLGMFAENLDQAAGGV